MRTGGRGLSVTRFPNGYTRVRTDPVELFTSIGLARHCTARFTAPRDPPISSFSAAAIIMDEAAVVSVSLPWWAMMVLTVKDCRF